MTIAGLRTCERPTAWLGREDSDFCISELGPLLSIMARDLRSGTTSFNGDAYVRILPPRAESPGEFRFGYAEVRILPPHRQPVRLQRIKG
jgi:hypothetical protein